MNSAVVEWGDVVNSKSSWELPRLTTLCWVLKHLDSNLPLLSSLSTVSSQCVLQIILSLCPLPGPHHYPGQLGFSLNSSTDQSGKRRI